MRIIDWSSDVCSSDLNQRDSRVELGNWLGLVAGSLGKMAGDILLMCQNEVGELREGAHNGQRGGGSSTLPQKSNPVRSEAVLSLARHAAGLVGQDRKSTRLNSSH